MKRDAKETPWSISIFSFTESGEKISRRISDEVNGVTSFPPGELKEGKLKKKIRAIFNEKPVTGGNRRAVIFVGAAGIAIRSIAPYLKGKERDPAVIVIDDRGRFAVSLLSGHLGGANELTTLIAKKISTTPVITTATDNAGLPCIEDIAHDFDLAIEEPRKIKIFNSAILRGEKIIIVVKDSVRRRKLKSSKHLASAFTFKSKIINIPDGPVAIITHETNAKNIYKKKNILFLRPRDFVVGIGCRRGVTIKEVAEAFDKTLAKHGINPLSVRNLATIDIKNDERGLIGFARRAGLQIDFLNAEELKKVKLPSGASPYVEKTVGVGGVCEPAALVSAGEKRIWIKKTKFTRVTIAIAKVCSTP